MRTKSGHKGNAGEKGQALVLVALLMVVLLGATSLSVDVGNLALARARMQKAADAAALSGAGSLATSATAAISTARTYATSNGFPNNAAVTTSGATDAGVTVTTPYGGNSSDIAVTISRNVDTYFAGLLGFRSFTVSAQSVAENQTRWIPPSTGTMVGVMPFAISTNMVRRQFEDERKTYAGGFFHEEIEMEYECEHGRCGYEAEGDMDDDEQKVLPLTASGDYYANIVGKDPNKQFTVSLGQKFDIPTTDMVWQTYQGIRQRMVDGNTIMLIPMYQSIGSKGDHDKYDHDSEHHRWITQVTIVGFVGVQFPGGPYTDSKGAPNPNPLPAGSDTSPGSRVNAEYNFGPSSADEFMEGEFESSESELEIESEDGRGPVLLGYYTSPNEFFSSYPGIWNSGTSMNGHSTNQPPSSSYRIRLKQ